MASFKFEDWEGGHLNVIVAVIDLHDGSKIKLEFTPRGTEAMILTKPGAHDVFVALPDRGWAEPAFRIKEHEDASQI